MPQVHPADMLRRDWLRAKLARMPEEQEAIRQSKSWQALVASERLELQYRNELDDTDKEEEANPGPQTMADVVRLFAAFPDAVFCNVQILQRLAQALTVSAAVTLLGMLPDEVFRHPDVAKRCS